MFCPATTGSLQSSRKGAPDSVSANFAMDARTAARLDRLMVENGSTAIEVYRECKKLFPRSTQVKNRALYTQDAPS